jgi:acyl transferase domain-containing protein
MKSRMRPQTANNGSADSDSALQRSSGQEPIAIIGIGCRYPGISNVMEFWQTLIDGREVVGPYPGGRFAELDRMFEEVRRKPGRAFTDRGGFFADIAGFDAQFFEISPRESVYVDPQHRLLLEVSWQALEDAGQVREAYQGSSTGVYAGLWTSEYENRMYESSTKRDLYSLTGCGRASASGRVSFTLGLQGPSITVDTACSSSLVAVHMACQALWAREVEMALAGGANAMLGPEIFELFTQARMLSPDGHCKFGDASADGFVRSEGAGMVVLKRLSQAIANKDPIYALIRGTAVNNDGHTSGFLTPSDAGQQQMLQAAWKSAGVDPRDIQYVEMHGTGTSVGDPIEIGSIGAALVERGISRKCLIGSAKTNLGHTESAAGVTGLIKAALAVHHSMVPPSLHCTVLNPKVPWDMLPVRIATKAVDLSGSSRPLIVGVNSFGLSGTNAHVVLDEMDRAEGLPSQGNGPYLLPISAKTPEALQALLWAHLEALRSGGEDYPVADVCYTAGARRTHHEQRAAIVAKDLAELELNLAAAIAGEEAEGIATGRIGSDDHRIVFVAPGQGSQWLGMARELFDGNPVFRRVFEECDAAIADETGWRLSSRLLGEDADLHIGSIDVIQPALFTMSVALAAVWRAWGIEPDVVVGHSMGEVAAAHIAGILSLEDAVSVICRRSRLMKTLRSAGSMATVELPLHEVELLLQSREGISVGASNGPHTTVVSGDSTSVEALLKELEEKEIYCRLIKVDVASHSAQVDPILEELFTSLAEIRPQPAKIPMLSTVAGVYADCGNGNGVAMDARYWVENLRRSVLFAPAIQALSSSGHDTFIELSPHPILLPSIEASAREIDPRAVAVASLRREKPERATLLAGLSDLYVGGRKIAWKKLYPEDARCVSLPQYPFQRERCWPEPADPEKQKLARVSSKADPLLGRSFESSLQPGALLWDVELDIAELPYLNDHRVLRSAVFPASAHVVMALAAARAARPGQEFELHDTHFVNAVYLPDKGRKILQLALIPEGNDRFRFELRGHVEQAEGEGEEKGSVAWTLYSSGIIGAVGLESIAAAGISIEELKDRCPIQCTSEEQYEKTMKSGLNYGPAFQLMEEAWLGDGECLCRVRCDVEDANRYVIHPALLDACFQGMVHVKPEQDVSQREDTYLPVSIERVRLYRAIPADRYIYAHVALLTDGSAEGRLRANLCILDADGNALADITGMELMRVTRETLQGSARPLYKLEWIETTRQTNAPEKAETAMALLSRVTGENWIIFADDTGIAQTMKVSLAAAGGRCTLVRAGSGFRKMEDDEFEIDPQRRTDLDRLFYEVSSGAGIPTAVVHLWTVNNNSAGEYDAAKLMHSQSLGSQQVAGLVQAITAANWQNPPRLWLVTSGVMAAGGSNGSVRIENAPMWGMGRSVVREHMELRTTLVDLSCPADPAEARALVLEICSQGKEDRIALRGGRKFVARLTKLTGDAPEAKLHPLASGEDYRLEISSAGIIDNIELRAGTCSVAQAGEITVEVSSAGLNFNDLLKVMGIQPGFLPGDTIPLGNEAVGRVTSIGAGVTGFRVGDQVIALTPNMRTLGMMSSRVTVPVELVVHKPASLSDEEAATVTIVYVTAYWSLIDQARLRKGEWVLIHAGAGGVGLAAIQIAKWIGANIIVTVGSPEKVEYMRSLGIEHVLDSRSLSFAAGVMEITNGRGVDVVLNSLFGEFLLKSMEVLAPYGRFVELGKRDVHADSRVGLRTLRNNNSFHVVDVAAGVEDRREYIAQMLAEVMRHIEAGEWASLPVTSFSSANPAEAFRFMAQARHIGKISIRMDRDVQVLPATNDKLFSSKAAYLITGGLGGVALTVAEWMAENGAGTIVLLSRRASSPETDEVIRRLETAGATVIQARADVTREVELKKVMEMLHARGLPLKGIMHTAAVVDDVLIRDVAPERFLPVMAPKIAGAWNLYAATKQEDLDFFVLFSSIAALYPQPGMGSYAAANAFLDAFAHFLRDQGTPAISVNWGGWDRIGLARAEGTGRSIDGYTSEGLRNLSPTEALDALRRILESIPIQALVVPFDAERFVEFHGLNNIPPAFADLVARTETKTGAESSHSEVLEQLSKADSAQRGEILEEHLQETLGRVLKLAANRIDRERLLGSMGLDSLMGLEFVRRLGHSLEIAVPATVVFNYPTIKLLAVHLLRRMQLEPAQDAAASTGQSMPVNPLSRKDYAIGDLSGDVSEEDALQALIGNGQRSF